MEKALENAIRDLYTAALCKERGNALRLQIRRLARRFLPQVTRETAEDEARIRGAEF